MITIFITAPSVHYILPKNYNVLKPDEVFAFGSNLAGMHGGGSARMAHMLFGAKMGQGVGMQGQSYAIPTMQDDINTIRPYYVEQFIQYAEEHPELFFYITHIGCGIVGFQDKETAPLSAHAVGLRNVCMPYSFIEHLEHNRS